MKLFLKYFLWTLGTFLLLIYVDRELTTEMPDWQKGGFIYLRTGTMKYWWLFLVGGWAYYRHRKMIDGSRTPA